MKKMMEDRWRGEEEHGYNPRRNSVLNETQRIDLLGHVSSRETSYFWRVVLAGSIRSDWKSILYIKIFALKKLQNFKFRILGIEALI